MLIRHFFSQASSGLGDPVVYARQLHKIYIYIYIYTRCVVHLRCLMGDLSAKCRKLLNQIHVLQSVSYFFK
jgi:hypothetical protein